MNGAEHGEAMTTASTPDKASLTYGFFAFQPASDDGSNRRISNRPDRFSASTKNSSARPATTTGDCSWKPQPSCAPAARSATSTGSEQPERNDDSRRECEPMLAHRRAIAAVRGETQNLQRQHREHAGHQIQQHAAEQGEGDRGAQRQRALRGRERQHLQPRIPRRRSRDHRSGKRDIDRARRARCRRVRPSMRARRQGA